MKHFILSIFLVLLVFGGIGCNKKIEPIKPIDYSETTWQEIKGYKNKEYGVSANIEYITKTNVCREKKSYWSMVDGKSGSYFTPKTNDLSFDAKTSKNKLSYVLHYPLNIKQEQCVFWADSIIIKIKENKEAVKNAFNPRIIKILYSSGENRVNYSYPLNIYCQRSGFFTKSTTTGKEEFNPIAFCRPTGVIGSAEAIHLDFLKEKYQPLKVNILVSDDIKCHRACTDKEMLKAETKEKMYEGRSDEPPTIDTRNERFVPSEALFTAFKEKNKIKE